MKTIRAKFYCTNVSDDDYGQHISLSAVYGTDDNDNEENNQFSDSTPSGNLTMQITNPTAKGFFKEAGEYYLDFSKAD